MLAGMQRGRFGAAIVRGVPLVVVVGSIAGGCGAAAIRDDGFGDGGSAGATSGGPPVSDAGSSSGGFGGSSSGELPACATASATAQRVPIYLDIVLDGSRSMDGYTNAATDANQATLCESGTYPWPPTGPGTCMLAGSRQQDPLTDRLTGKKWLAARGALKAFFDARAASPDPALGIGLFLFSSTASRGEPVALLDPAHAARLWDVIDPGTWPDLGTPLEASIDSQAAELRAFAPAATLLPGGRRVILLVTDGVPDTVSLRPGVRTAVTAARTGTPSVATAVIGIGNPSDDPDTVYDSRFLGELAQLGGVAPAGCDPSWTETSGTTPCYLQVTPGASSAAQLQAELGAAIDGIAGQLASCELALDKTSPIDPARVNVVYVDASGTATQVAQDPAQGWSYDDPANPSTVRLHGESCRRFQATPGGRVDIVVGCPTGTTVAN